MPHLSVREEERNRIKACFYLAIFIYFCNFGLFFISLCTAVIRPRCRLSLGGVNPFISTYKFSLTIPYGMVYQSV